MPDSAIGTRPVVLVWYVSMMRHFVTRLAQELRQRYGLDCVLLTYHESNLPHPGQFGFDPRAFREIVHLADCLTSPLETASPGALADAAAAVERRLGCRLIDLVRCDRQLGQGFVLGADFARPAELVGLDADALQAIATQFVSKIEELLARLRPVAAISSPGSIGPATLNALADARGLPCRQLVLARFDSRLCWTTGWYIMPVGLAEAFTKHLAETPMPDISAGNISEVRSQTLAARPKQYDAWLEREGDATSLGALVRSYYRALRKNAGQRLLHPGKRHGRYRLRDELRLILRLWRWRGQARRAQPILPTLPVDLRYVYFPLHVEPESGVMVEAQTADNQLACIDWLAKNLPGHWRLIVKEHPALHAPRPPGFHRRIDAYPNVMRAGTWESNETLVAGARAVATINGSTGIQAAVAGQPVICFNATFHGAIMPHVLLARSYAETRTALSRIQDGDIPDAAERRRAGQAFVRAANATSFAVTDQALRDQLAGTIAISTPDAEVLADTFIEACGLAALRQRVAPAVTVQ